MRALLAGDVRTAVRMNPFGPVMAALVALFVVASVVDAWRTSRGPATADRAARARSGRSASDVVARAMLVVAGLEVALWLLRFAGLFGGPVPVEVRSAV